MPAVQRSILRGIHLLLSIPLVGYVYSPFQRLPDYAPLVRYVAAPAIVVSGLLLWKGHLLRRFATDASGRPGTAATRILR